MQLVAAASSFEEMIRQRSLPLQQGRRPDEANHPLANTGNEVVRLSSKEPLLLSFRHSDALADYSLFYSVTTVAFQLLLTCLENFFPSP